MASRIPHHSVDGLTNFALNESFLSSAQLRPSVVSHAETLGYYPRSRTSSTATVKITIPSTGDLVTDIVELPKNTTTFKTSLDDVTYTFRTVEKYIAQNDGNGNFAGHVRVYEFSKENDILLKI